MIADQPPSIKTASWFAWLPNDHVKIGISRGVPHSRKAELPPLARPGTGKSFDPAEYICRHDRIRARPPRAHGHTFHGLTQTPFEKVGVLSLTPSL